MRTLQLLAPFAVLALVASATRADTIVGQVIDADGNPVFGVDIDVKNEGSGGDPDIFNDGTDVNGNFATTLPAGEYRITFNPPPPPASTGLIVQLDDVSVSGTTNLGVIQLPPGVALTGRVITGGSTAVSNVNIDVIDKTTGDNMDLVADNTNALGNFSIAVPEGPIEVRFDATPVVGPTLASLAVTLTTTGDTSLGDVALAPGFTLSAFVLGPGGQPLSDTDTDAVDASTGQTLYTPGDNTSGSGFVSVVVPAGTVDFRVCPNPSTGIVAQELPGVVVAGNMNLGIFNLSAGQLLSGTVRDGGNQPIAGVDIDIGGSGSGIEQFVCNDNTNGTGQYTVVVPNGTWDVTFTPPYSQPFGSAAQANVFVGAGGATVNATLPDCAFNLPYGNGLAGAGGLVPVLGSTGGAPRLGNPDYAITMADGRGGATAAFLMGFGPASLPFKQGALLIDIVNFPWLLLTFPLPGAPGVAGAGDVTIPLPVPDLPEWDGFSLYFQMMVQDNQAIAGWSQTNGMQVLYCD